MATMATTRCMKVMGDLRQLGNVNLRAAANSAISAHPHPRFGTRATMRALAALIGAVAHLAGLQLMRLAIRPPRVSLARGAVAVTRALRRRPSGGTGHREVDAVDDWRPAIVGPSRSRRAGADAAPRVSPVKIARRPRAAIATTPRPATRRAPGGAGVISATAAAAPGVQGSRPAAGGGPIT